MPVRSEPMDPSIRRLLTRARDARIASVEHTAEAHAHEHDLIRKAHAEGCTLEAIAKVAKLSKGRIHQIVHGR